MTTETQNKFAAILAAAQAKANIQAQPKQETEAPKPAVKEVKPELSNITIDDLLKDCTPAPEQTKNAFDLVSYSDKAIAIFGNTKAIKEDLKAFGGRFNPFLNYNGNKSAGWIFSKAKETQLRNFINSFK